MNLQNYYDTVIQLSHGIVVTLDLDGKVVHGNSELEQLTGYSMNELAGKDWFDTFMPEDERELARHAILERAHDQGVSAMAGSIRDRDGDRVYINWNLKPLSDSDGNVISILCVGQDVTDQTLRENGLLRERFTLLERNKELDFLYRLSLLMGDMSPDLEDILGTVVTMLPSAFQHPESTHVRLDLDTDSWKTPDHKVTDNILIEQIMVHKERRGTLAVCVENGYRTPVFIDDEKDLLATTAQQIAVIVAKKETREAKQTLESQLRQADRLAKIGQFSAGVAHEINEPLANILGLAELSLQTEGLSEQVREDLDSIVESSLHAREVIRKLMFFARQLPPQMIDIDFNEVVEQALSIIETGARRKSIHVRRDYTKSLPQIPADPQHIKQVVVNLVANSIHAMDDGGELTVSTECHGNDAYLIVEDTGPGMEPGILRQIFNPFFTTKDIDKGTGLGLSVVHGIVKSHEGFIQVHSKPGKGTRVEVTFPCPNCNRTCEE